MTLIRIPYLQAWDRMYRDQGLVILGVHSPEFAFEKDLTNLARAMAELGVTWPVVQDNDFGIWNAFRNRYWPSHYLFDQEGKMVQKHFGEGAYMETEELIQTLLGTAAPLEAKTLDRALATPFKGPTTPETYLGTRRGRQDPWLIPKDGVFSPPAQLPLDAWNLEGPWVRMEESILLQGQGLLSLRYTARELFMVAGTPEGKPVEIQIFRNGIPWDSPESPGGKIILGNKKLHRLLLLPAPEEGLLEIHGSGGVEIYTFTFG